MYVYVTLDFALSVESPTGHLETLMIWFGEIINLEIMVSFQNPEYMKNDFFIKIETMHLGDNGTTENVSRSHF